MILRRRELMVKNKDEFPSGYTKLNWIGAKNTTKWTVNGTVITGAYIDPKVVFSGTNKTGLKTILAMDGTSTDVSYTGAVCSGNKGWLCAGSYGIGIMYALNVSSSRQGPTIPFDTEFHEYVAIPGFQSIDGGSITNYAATNAADSDKLPVLLLSHSYNFNGVHNCRSRMKYAELYENDNMIRKMVPCKRNSDSAIGMFDLCGSICPLTGTPFYTNAGTGSFTYG